MPHYGRGAATATCPPGKRALGGGLNSTGPVLDRVTYEMARSGPLGAAGSAAATGNGDVARSWLAEVRNFSGDTQLFKTIALCASDPQPGESGGGSSPAGGGGGSADEATSCKGRRGTIFGSARSDVVRGTPGAA